MFSNSKGFKELFYGEIIQKKSHKKENIYRRPTDKLSQKSFVQPAANKIPPDLDSKEEFPTLQESLNSYQNNLSRPTASRTSLKWLKKKAKQDLRQRQVELHHSWYYRDQNPFCYYARSPFWDAILEEKQLRVIEGQTLSHSRFNKF